MKKILLIALIFLTHNFCFSKEIDLYYGTSITMPFFKIQLNFFEEINNLKYFDKYNYGISVFSKNLYPKVPLTIKIGKLSISDGQSLLNSPNLSSSISPFFNSASPKKNISASLPSFSTFSKPLTFFLQFELNKNKSNLIINSVYIPEKEHTISFSIKYDYQLKNKNLFSVVSSGGIFPYAEFNNNSWYSQQEFFHKGKLYCQNINLRFKGKKGASSFTTTLYTSPFGKINFTFRNENKLHIRNFIFNFQEFLNTNEKIITSSEKKLKPMFQIKSGLQYQFIYGIQNPIFIKIGSGSYFEYNLLSTEKNHTLKNSFGVKMIHNSYSFLAFINMDFTIVENQKTFEINYNNFSFNLRNYFYTKNINPFINFTFKLEPNLNYTNIKTSEKINLGFTIPQKNSISIHANMTISQKNKKFEKISFESYILGKFMLKKISCTVKLSAGW